MIYNLVKTSREARLLLCFGATALYRRWLSDSASSNALSISLFAAMANMEMVHMLILYWYITACFKELLCKQHS